MRWTGERVRWRTAILLGVWAATASSLPAGKDQTPELDVPFVPTEQRAVEEMLKLAKVTSADTVIDLGCGDGRIVITAAKKYKAKGLGVDLDPKRVRESKENAKKAKVTDLVEFRKADVMVTDVRRATVVTLFLLEDVNVRLRPKLFAELKPGTRVVSNGFHMRDWKADKVVRFRQAYNKAIYFWTIPAAAGGTWTWQTQLGGKEIAGSLSIVQEFQAVRGAIRHGGTGSARLIKPSLVGKELRFTARLRVENKPVVVAYSGTVEGDVIRGTQEWPGGPYAGKHPWTAKRKPADITGQWQVRAASRSGCDGTLRIRREGDGFRAIYVRDDNPKVELALSGFYVWGSSVRFEVPLAGIRLAFRGRLEGDAGGGTVSPERSRRRGRWSAKRLASK